ncbi:cysteine desulfurase family protein [Sphingomonas endolithica]|uniref:cysteine desulfurase family protein n=1 Tax=Sphingomonas endolithica TaxID=2972485 RepID=UPI0021AF7A34|nr:aminotransferase class V-fold PLP-dependent enzyme [Sphingomonas sp. ZFBP2030]
MFSQLERLLPDPTHARVYLDHAATTPMLPCARAAVADGMAHWANPSSPHAEGRAAKAALEEARRAVAAAYGWTGETLFTSGASESLAIALQRAAATTRIITAVEHDAVMRWADPQAIVLPVGTDGVLSIETLRARLVAGGRALVTVQWANSETGVRQPIAAIAAAVHEAGGLLLVDAAQMPVGVDAEVAEHADFVALSAHKRGGPPGIGALLVRDLGSLSPTGGQERGYRPGTENLPAAIGYAAALGEAEPLAEQVRLRAVLDDAVVRSGGEVICGGSPRHPAIGAYRMPGVASFVQLIDFDAAGFAVSAGSACASGSMKPSHVLGAIGLSDAARREVVRASFGRTTSEEEVRAFIAAWRGVARAKQRFVA